MASNRRRSYPPGSTQTATRAHRGANDPEPTADQREITRRYERSRQHAVAKPPPDCDAVWTTWANEVLTMPLTQGDDRYQVESLHDSWDGFQHERWELMQHVADANPRDFLTLTGDLHCAMAGYQLDSYQEVTQPANAERVGVELLTPGLSSINAADVLEFPDRWDDDELEELAREKNPHLEHVDWRKHGYAVVEFTREEARYTVWRVDATDNSPDAERARLREYVVPDGDVRLRRTD